MTTRIKIDELPDGITVNAYSNKTVELEFQSETINSSKCSKCDIIFESILVTNNGRHEGIITTANNNTAVWKNSMPKDRTRCIKMLDEILMTKLDKHNERHNND